MFFLFHELAGLLYTRRHKWTHSITNLLSELLGFGVGCTKLDPEGLSVKGVNVYSIGRVRKNSGGIQQAYYQPQVRTGKRR